MIKKENTMKKMVSRVTLALFALVPASALALNDVVIKDPNPTADTLKEVIGLVKTWVVLLVGAIAVLFIIYGGILYVTSAGNKEKAEQAKQTLTYAVLGLIIIVLANVIISIAMGLPTDLGITS